MELKSDTYGWIGNILQFPNLFLVLELSVQEVDAGTCLNHAEFTLVFQTPYFQLHTPNEVIKHKNYPRQTQAKRVSFLVKKIR